MDDDQQFCLRWNNHQSTLIAVFDTLLEKGVHVDCTLAAEGQTLKAHKVVLSACSPYFENVLSQQYDKHPIIILKDVKFAELKAMMDYMYRGEVNISQDQLAALLKAAESLQIKGLSDSKPPPPRASSPLIRGRIVDSAVSGQIHSREGSSSPLPRKRKKVRRSSLNDTDAEVLNNSDHIPSLNHMPSSVPVTPRPPAVEPSVENDIVAANKVLPAEANDIAVKVKNDISARDDIEPKGELICEDGTEDSVEDLTLDEEIDSETEHSGPGPSHPQGDCVQSFAWHMDRAQDESTPSMDGQRDSQASSKQVPNYVINYILENSLGKNGGMENTYPCAQCGNTYKHKGSLQRHIKYECRKPPGFQCPYCSYKAYQKHNLLLHERHLHKDLPEEVVVLDLLHENYLDITY